MLYKGIFWYDPGQEKLISKKVACDKNGAALESVEYSSKSGDNFNHKAEWAKFTKDVTGGKPYNYFPRGRVEIKKNKATVYLNPVLNTPAVSKLIIFEFGLCNGTSTGTIIMRTVADGSTHYDYLIDYPIQQCTMCGKVFNYYDNQENLCFDHYFGYGSSYDIERIQLKLCCDCSDKVLDWLLPQCVSNPMTEYD